jgi:hypothetical protein
MSLPECREEELPALYAWLDSVPLSRPRRSVARDFADGCLLAEVIAHYHPRLVELHNYSPASGAAGKLKNLEALERRVLRRLGAPAPPDALRAVALGEPGAAEALLKAVRGALAARAAARGAQAEAGGKAGGKAGGDADADAANTAGGLIPSHPGAAAAAEPSAAAAAAAKDDDSPAARAERCAAAEAENLDLRALVGVLEAKAAKLEALVRLKDARCSALAARLAAAGLG